MPSKNKNEVTLDSLIKNSDIRENLMNWYDFEQNSNILFIGDDYYYCLSKKSNNVTVLEVNKERFEKIKGLKVKRVVNKTLNDLLDEKSKYDYVVVSSAMQRIGEFVDKKKRKDAFLLFLNIISNIISEDGVVLFPIENKFSIKNFSGATTNGSASYDVICGKEKNGAIYTKNEIKELVDKSNFKNITFYYPFPDHKLPSVIYSSEYLPNGNNSKLSYLIYFNPKDTIIFNEMEAIREIVKDGTLDYFANSFFIQISNSTKRMSKVKFASFNNLRKKENKLITKMYKDYVEKVPIFSEGNAHIEKMNFNIEVLEKCGIDIKDRVENGKLISPYQDMCTFNEFLSKLIDDDDYEIAISLIEKWYSIILEKFKCLFCESSGKSKNVFEKYDIIVQDDLYKRMHLMSTCLFDYIFENIFVEIDDNYNFKKIIAYDQEWKEDYAPIEFILYRAIKNFYNKSKIGKYIKIEELFEKLGISDFVEIFNELEDKIQDSLLDHSIAKSYEASYVALTNIEGLNSICNFEREKYNNLLNQVNETNLKWEEENNNLRKALNKYREKDIIYKLKKKFKK